jgi:hypothetical protein
MADTTIYGASSEISKHSPLFGQIVAYCATRNTNLTQIPNSDIVRIFQTITYSNMTEEGRDALNNDVAVLMSKLQELQRDNKLPLNTRNAATVLNQFLPLLANISRHMENELERNPVWKTGIPAANIDKVKHDLCEAYTFIAAKTLFDTPSVRTNETLKQVAGLLVNVTTNAKKPNEDYTRTLSSATGTTMMEHLHKLASEDRQSVSLANFLGKIREPAKPSGVRFTEEMHQKNEERRKSSVEVAPQTRRQVHK